MTIFSPTTPMLKVGEVVHITPARQGSGWAGITSERPPNQIGMICARNAHGEWWVIWSAFPGHAEGDWFDAADLAPNVC